MAKCGFFCTRRPPDDGMPSTEWLARHLGFRFSYVPDHFNLWRGCRTKFCVAI
jgi:hypothetical protein